MWSRDVLNRLWVLLSIVILGCGPSESDLAPVRSFRADRARAEVDDKSWCVLRGSELECVLHEGTTRSLSRRKVSSFALSGDLVVWIEDGELLFGGCFFSFSPRQTHCARGGYSGVERLAPGTRFSDAIQLRVSGGHVCVVTDAGVLFCGGYNAQYAVDPSSPSSEFVSLHAIRMSAQVRDVATALNATCAETDAGDVVCWGGRYGRAYGSLPDAIAIAGSGPASMCTLTREHRLDYWRFGDNPNTGVFEWHSERVPISGARDCLIAERVASSEDVTGRRWWWGSHVTTGQDACTISRPCAVGLPNNRCRVAALSESIACVACDRAVVSCGDRAREEVIVVHATSRVYRTSDAPTNAAGARR